MVKHVSTNTRAPPISVMRVFSTLIRAPSSKVHHAHISTGSTSSRFASSAALRSPETSHSTPTVPATKQLRGSSNSLGRSTTSGIRISHSNSATPNERLGFKHHKRVDPKPQTEPEWDNTVEEFDLIVQNQTLDTIPTGRLVKLIQHFAISAENITNPAYSDSVGLPQQFGHRMGVALEELEGRKGDSAYPSSYRVQCWRIEAEANCGRPEAIVQLPPLQPPPRRCEAIPSSAQTTETYVRLRTLRRVLLIHLLSSQPLNVPFMLLHDHWAFLEPILLFPRGSFNYKIEREAESLRPLALNVARQFHALYELSPDSLANTNVLKLVLMAHCEREAGAMAVKAYHLLRRHQVELPTSLAALLVRTLVGDGLLEDAESLVCGHPAIFDPNSADIQAHEAVLGLYARKGMSRQAEERFKLLGALNPAIYHDRHFTWMMQAAATGGHVSDAIRLFQKFFELKREEGGFCRKPTAHHYGIVIQAHVKAGDSEGVSYWARKLFKCGLPVDAPIFNAVLQFYATRSDFKAIHSTLQDMRDNRVQWTATTYTILITAFAERKDPSTVELLGKRAIQEGLQPDTRMVYAMLNAYAQANSWDGVIRVFDYLESNKQSPITYTTPCFNHIIKAYVSIGSNFTTILHTFRRMKSIGLRPSQSTYMHVIRSAAENGRMEDAMKLFYELEKLPLGQKGGLELHASALTVIMGGYLRIRARKKAREILDEMMARGLKPDISCIAHIIKAYANEQTPESLELAEQFLTDALYSLPEGQRLPETNALNQLFSPVMHAHAARGNAEKVEQYSKWLLDLGSKLTPYTLTIILDAHRRAGDIEAVKKTWQRLVDTVMGDPAKSVIADMALLTSHTQQQRLDTILTTPLSIYIDALSTAGLYNEIAAVWKTMKDAGLAFDPDNWNHLTLALIRAGQLERAFQVIEAVIIPSRRQHSASLLANAGHVQRLFPLDLGGEMQHDGSGPALHSADRRSSAARSARRTQYRAPNRTELGAPQSSAPIRLFRQTSPVMNLWRAHAATLNALHNVLLRLRDGYIIHPHGLSRHQPTHDYNPVEAAQILRRIRTAFPLTTRLITRPKSRYHKARTRSRRKDPHGWLVGVRFGPQPHWSRARALQKRTMRRNEKLKLQRV